ncbi:hypothetical protein [Photobacterium chitinilyticum]|uniref:Uncharacterized protein n=1 Tax=Photobacterium chitinilyticum TaxID=2485123 RepID=A0A3S4TL87_9GAMM|nr:hypothetical protein [Photobacterium chitinilyticum]RWX55082.1 hypothetical protein EDI28_15250 [Photobacterium chitinilyticum]
MLAEYRQFVLPRQRGLHAEIIIIPTGELKVNIKEKNNSLKAEFDELYFHSAGKETELVCRDQLGTESVRWHLHLANDDARELAMLIESAEEEFEALMRDL